MRKLVWIFSYADFKTKLLEEFFIDLEFDKNGKITTFEKSITHYQHTNYPWVNG